MFMFGWAIAFLIIALIAGPLGSASLLEPHSRPPKSFWS